jgi:hypothetical protein
MNIRTTLFFRGFAGFIVGSVVAAVVTVIIFMTICKEPAEVPGQPDYYPDAVTILGVVTFLCGGLIGMRGFIARRAASLLWPVVGSYIFMLLLCFGKEASFHEGAPLIAFASVGIAASVGVSLAVLRWFPRKGLHDVA